MYLQQSLCRVSTLFATAPTNAWKNEKTRTAKLWCSTAGSNQRNADLPSRFLGIFSLLSGN